MGEYIEDDRGERPGGVRLRYSTPTTDRSRGPEAATDAGCRVVGALGPTPYTYSTYITESMEKCNISHRVSIIYIK